MTEVIMPQMLCPVHPVTRELSKGALGDALGIEPWKSLILYSLVRAGGMRKVVEIGVYQGTTLSWLLQAVADHEQGGTVYALDIQPLERTRQVISTLGLDQFVEWHTGRPSWETAAELPDELDLVFVDGDHLFPGCQYDLEAFWPKLRAGGLMVFDDVVSWGGCGDVWHLLNNRFPANQVMWLPILPHPLREIRVGLAIAQKGRPEYYEWSAAPKVEPK